MPLTQAPRSRYVPATENHATELCECADMLVIVSLGADDLARMPARYDR